jgi:hypothetical protein
VTRTTKTQLIAEKSPNLNIRKITRLALKPKLEPERSLLPSFFEEINALNRQLQLKSEKSARRKKSKTECLLFSIL